MVTATEMDPLPASWITYTVVKILERISSLLVTKLQKNIFYLL
jgi:hypothetical protein